MPIRRTKHDDEQSDFQQYINNGEFANGLKTHNFLPSHDVNVFQGPVRTTSKVQIKTTGVVLDHTFQCPQNLISRFIPSEKHINRAKGNLSPKQSCQHLVKTTKIANTLVHCQKMLFCTPVCIASFIYCTVKYLPNYSLKRNRLETESRCQSLLLYSGTPSPRNRWFCLL